MVDDIVVAAVSIGALILWNVNWWLGWRFTTAHAGPLFTHRFKRAARSTMIASVCISLTILASAGAGELFAEFHAFGISTISTYVFAASVVVLVTLTLIAAWFGVWPLWFVAITRLSFGEAKAVERVQEYLRSTGAFLPAA